MPWRLHSFYFTCVTFLASAGPIYFLFKAFSTTFQSKCNLLGGLSDQTWLLVSGVGLDCDWMNDFINLIWSIACEHQDEAVLSHNPWLQIYFAWCEPEVRTCLIDNGVLSAVSCCWKWGGCISFVMWSWLSPKSLSKICSFFLHKHWKNQKKTHYLRL